MTHKEAYLRFFVGFVGITLAVGLGYFATVLPLIFVLPLMGFLYPRNPASAGGSFWPRSRGAWAAIIVPLSVSPVLIRGVYSGVYDRFGLTAGNTLTFGLAATLRVIFASLLVIGLLLTLERVAAEVD